ncbi:MAG: pyridoxamine 5'-phosphate oxidase [Chitinophagales bacterium]|jgi:pyridoxamine 5'-phosphate oxidase|nr:pyridoxamine 5'-phosphate oxidase [Sphingobacteriales bacterium]
MNLSDWRTEYDKYNLHEENLPSLPLDLFRLWFDKAVEDLNPEPNAFILSTVSADLQPKSRVVLLKEIEAAKFVFYTNYSSQKGQDLQTNPKTSMLFFFPFSQRQIRIEGKVSKLSREKAVEYFASRPVESQVSAMASSQSRIVKREALIEKAAELRNAGNIVCPEDWGGYAIEPHYFEFWQGQPGRLHDRIIYNLDPHSHWEQYRIAP